MNPPQYFLFVFPRLIKFQNLNIVLVILIHKIYLISKLRNLDENA